jgi:hypothetical protein
MPRTGDKNAFDALCKELENIRKELKKCPGIENLHSIISKYQQIDTHRNLIKGYTAENKIQKNKLTELDGKIAILILNQSQRYELKQPTLATPESTSAEGTSINTEVYMRTQQLNEYNKWIIQLETKRDELHTRYPKDSSDDMDTAYGAACQLVNILNGYAVSYINQDIDLKKFKEHSSRVINTKRNGVLGEHRGIKELLTNLLLAIATLGLGYAIAALFTQSLTPLKCKTKTVYLLDDTDKALNEVGNN